MTDLYDVYCHTSPYGKRYIGITSKSISERAGKGGIHYKKNAHFWSAIRKYGWDSFGHEVVLSRITKEQACDWEQILIRMYDSANPRNGYNQSTGGEKPSLGVKISEEKRAKLRAAKLGKHYGKQSDEWVENRLESRARHNGKYNPWSGGHLSPLHLAHLRAAHENIIPKNARSVTCIETGVVYPSTYAAARSTGCYACSISRVCLGRLYSTNKLHWKYTD